MIGKPGMSLAFLLIDTVDRFRAMCRNGQEILFVGIIGTIEYINDCSHEFNGSSM